MNIVERANVRHNLSASEIPTKEDFDTLKQYMDARLSPNGNRYGSGLVMPNFYRFKNFIAWRYRLSNAEVERIAMMALVEELASELLNDPTLVSAIEARENKQ